MNYEQKKEAINLARKAGLTARDIARLFAVNERQVQAWIDEIEKDQRK